MHHLTSGIVKLMTSHVEANVSMYRRLIREFKPVDSRKIESNRGEIGLDETGKVFNLHIFVD